MTAPLSDRSPPLIGAASAPLSDRSPPLIGAASAGQLRLVRLLVEGGAEVNGRNTRGETALLAACKALRGEPGGPQTVRLLTYLLRNKADPDAQDCAGRTALMYACMERAGAQVASALLAAGADPSMEDHCGASALVYAVNAQHRPTLKVLMDACRARGRDIIIIATEAGASGGPVTRRYLNAPPSPDASPACCMSPSDILLKTGPPGSAEGESVFDFGATHKRGSGDGSRRSAPPTRHRISSKPWLAIHDVACLNRAHREAVRGRSPRGGGGGEDEGQQVQNQKGGWAPGREAEHEGGGYNSCSEGFPHLKRPPEKKPPACPAPPSVTAAPPQLHLPPLAGRSNSFLRVPTTASPSRRWSAAAAAAPLLPPHPPDSAPPASARPGSLPRLPPAQLEEAPTEAGRFLSELQRLVFKPDEANGACSWQKE